MTDSLIGQKSRHLENRKTAVSHDDAERSFSQAYLPSAMFDF